MGLLLIVSSSSVLCLKIVDVSRAADELLWLSSLISIVFALFRFEKSRFICVVISASDTLILG